MDELKDTNRTESLARYLDAHPIRTNPFGDNRAGERAYRRAERIVAALFLLTNHVSDREAIRSEVRAAATSLLNHALSLRDEMRAPQSRTTLSLLSEIRRTISLARILAISGFVSIQNTDIVIEALDDLGSFVSTSQRSILAESTLLSRDDLADVHIVQRATRTFVKDTRVVKDIREIKDAQETEANRIGNDGHGTARAQGILEILRTGGMLGIKEICANLPEYSEKMIQRELLTLVGQGAIKKTGLKRWSRYSLA